MMKKYKNTIFSIDLMLFFILTAIFIVILISPWIHQRDVTTYHLDVYSGLDKATIARNFASLSGYLWLFCRTPLSLESFEMSRAGAIHFAEVKNLVDLLQVIWLITGMIGLYGIYRRLKKGEIAFLKQTSQLMIIVPSAIGVLASLDFNEAFITFHQLFFRNDYWIFDERTDPVIKILPEPFFMHCFFAIVIVVLLLAVMLYGYYRYRIYQEKAKKLS